MSHTLLRPSSLLAILFALCALLMVPALDRAEVVAAAPADACGARTAKADGSLWNCTFVDDFTGTQLDATKWVSGDTARSGFHMNRTCFKPGQGYAVAQGQLALTVDRRRSFYCKTPTGGFTATALGAGISTWGKFAQANGRFEARMKFPLHKGVGLHGGYWMNPEKLTYGAWPRSGEIDVAEWFSQTPDQAYPSLHYSGRTTADTGWNCLVANIDQFHTYSVVWSPTVMQFFYDGQLCFSRSWAPTNLAAPKPFDMPFTQALLAAQGGGTNAPTLATPKVATTVVDYVKVWS